jgi:hypothetical protein
VEEAMGVRVETAAGVVLAEVLEDWCMVLQSCPQIWVVEGGLPEETVVGVFG